MLNQVPYSYGQIGPMITFGRNFYPTPMKMCESGGHTDYAEVHTDKYDVYNEYSEYSDYDNYSNSNIDPCNGGWS